ncbi:MAG: aspartate carbamoyltransferase catalytic subunit [Phycisphaerales bacterium]|jgi:aspartate carbamoyltransferase catalytic subunit
MTDSPRHLLGLEGVAAERIVAWLDRAEWLLGGAVSRSLEGKVVAKLFMEPSTRTRLSFETAAHRLGGSVVSAAASASSVSKGETILDTVRNVAALGVDAIVLRCAASGGAKLAASASPVPVLNGGDGRHEHPTQGLLDLLSLRRSLGELDGRRIAIVGDLANSRVARSGIHGMLALGAVPILVGPPTLVPPEVGRIAARSGGGELERCHDFDAVLPSLDAVVMLRVQRERDAGSAIASDYPRGYRLDRARAAKLRDGAPILHPGPVNRGFEIAPEVADDPTRSVILRQVADGVAVRMAVLEWAMGGQG